MANAFIGWLHKKVAAPVENAVSDVAHFGEDNIAKPVVNAVEHPTSVIQPVIHTLNTDVVHPIEHAPQNFINDVSTPISNEANKTAFGRGVTDVALGGYRAAVGLGQAGMGLANLAARHNVLGHVLPGGTSLDEAIARITNRGDKSLDRSAVNADVTVGGNAGVKYNKGLYEGSQVAANTLPMFLTGGESEAVEGADEGAQAPSKVSSLEKAQQLLTKPFDETTHTGRIAINTVKGALSPKNFAYNAGYQGYSAGQQSSQGKKINPVSQAESLGVFQLGFPLLGAASKEGLHTVAPVLVKTGKGLVSKFGSPAIKGAEKLSGLSKDSILNDNDANGLRDEASRIMGDKVNIPAQQTNNTHLAARQIGLDITSGSPAERAGRIENYLSQRRNFVEAHNAIGQGGYAKIPFGKNDIAPDLSDEQKEFVNDYANMLEGMDSSAGVSINKETGVRSSSNSPFYRDTFAETGKPPTKAQWFDEARNQLENGKGAFGASDEYTKLPTKVEPEQSATEPTDSTEPSKEELNQALSQEPELPSRDQTQEPTAVKDILQEKQSALSSPDNTPEHTASVNPPSGNIADIAEYDRLTSEGKEVPADLASRVGQGPKNDLADPGVYARTFGVSRIQAIKDFKQMAADATEQRSLSAKELADLGPEQKLSVDQKRNLIKNDERQFTTNKPELTPLQDTNQKTYSLKDRARSAIAQAEGINEEAEHRLQRAAKVSGKLSQNDKELLYEYDDGAAIGTLLKKADNPSLFNKAANLYKDSLDYDLAAKREGGSPILRQSNYVPHNYDVSESWLKAHGVPEDQWIKGKDNTVKGFRDVKAKYGSYAQAEKETNGALKPLYSSPVEDLKDYIKGGGILRRNNLLSTALAKSTPDDIGTLDEVKTPEQTGGKRLTQGAGNLPFSVTDELQKNLKGYRQLGEPSNIVTKAAGKAASGANYLTKRVLFLGTPYHYINEQGSFIGKNILHPLNLAKGEARFVTTVATRGGYQRLLDRAATLTLKDGTPLLEAIRKMGVVLPDDSSLNRASSAFSLTEAEAALRRGLNPNSKEAVDLGQQINHLMGHRNLAVEGESPIVHKILSFGTLAPSWSTTQLGLLKDALTKSFRNPAGNYARSAVLGKRFVLGATGVGGSYAISRKLPTKSQFLNEFGLTPKNPVPNIEIKSKNKSGESQEIVTPTDPFGLAYGLATNPSHFVQSRLSPLLTFGSEALTNTNWNGEPLAEGPHTPAYYKQLVENAAKNSLLPIGVQDLTNFSRSPNNPSIEQGIEEDFGGRLKTNPNDPKYKAEQQYYSALDWGQNQFVPNSPAEGAFLESFGVTKDPVTGKYLMTPNSEMTVAKSASLNAYPQANGVATTMMKRLASEGQKVDPYYLLTPAQQKAYNAYETMAPLSADRTNWQNNNKWYNAFAQKEQTYFNSLPAESPNKPQNPIKYPTFSKQTTNDLNTYYNLNPNAKLVGPNGTTITAKDNFLDAHPDVVTAMNQTFAYDNAVRVARGYAPLKGYPAESPQLSAQLAHYDTLDKADAKAYAAANPDIYKFFAEASEYDLNKDTGLNQIQGNNLLPSEVKTINSLGQDIYYDGGLPNNNGGDESLVSPTGATPGETEAQQASSGNYAYINPSYLALHAMLRAKKPTVVKLKKQSGLAAPIKASYKKPKSSTPTFEASTISRGRPKIGSKQKVTV